MAATRRIPSGPFRRHIWRGVLAGAALSLSGDSSENDLVEDDFVAPDYRPGDVAGPVCLELVRALTSRIARSSGVLRPTFFDCSATQVLELKAQRFERTSVAAADRSCTAQGCHRWWFARGEGERVVCDASEPPIGEFYATGTWCWSFEVERHGGETIITEWENIQIT